MNVIQKTATLNVGAQALDVLNGTILSPLPMTANVWQVSCYFQSVAGALAGPTARVTILAGETTVTDNALVRGTPTAPSTGDEESFGILSWPDTECGISAQFLATGGTKLAINFTSGATGTVIYYAVFLDPVS